MKIAMIFPGYGSQFVGMGKELYDEYRVVQEYFEEASNCLNTNFVKLCFASSDVELAEMNNAYNATFLVSSAIYALLKEEGIIPEIVVGYNQGEYAAVFAGGGLTFPDGLYLLSKYASFYQEALKDMDVSVVKVQGVPTKKIEELCLQASSWTDKQAFVAVYYTDTINIIAGDNAAIERIRELTSELSNVQVDTLGIEVGLHSSLMNGVVDQFEIYLEKVDFKDLSIPMIEAVNGSVIEKSHIIRDHIVRQMNSAIVWTRIITSLKDYDILVEIGPGHMLSKMLKMQYPEKHVIAINKRADVEELQGMLQEEI